MLAPVGQDRLPILGFFKLNFILYLVCVVWLLIILIVPVAMPKGTIDFGDTGYVGYSEHYNEIQAFNNPFVESVYNSGDRMCHMKSSRSLFINDNQMPYCARCFGVFFGFALGAAIASFIIVELKWWMLVIGLGPIGLDGGIQLISNYESINFIRIITGSLAGVVTMMAMGLIIYEISDVIKRWLAYRMWVKRQAMYRSTQPKKT